MGRKERKSIPGEVAAEALFRAARICCVCRQVGKEVQLHHIDENPANNALSNLAALCFDCHNDTQTRGGFGRRLDALQVTRFRDDHVARIELQRDQASITLSVSSPEPGIAPLSERRPQPPLPSRVGLLHYIDSLPRLRWHAYNAVGAALQGTTADMLAGTYRVVHALEAILNVLASFYPDESFDHQDRRDFISEVIAQRFRWHYAIGEPDGMGSAGTMASTNAVASTLTDIEDMIEDMVYALNTVAISEVEGFDIGIWKQRWHRDTDAPPEEILST